MGEKQQEDRSMITKELNRVTLKKSKENVTGKMGLGWIGHCLRDYGLKAIIDKHYLGRRNSNRQIEASRKIEASVLMFIAGGQRIEDIENLRVDSALVKVLGWGKMISPDTLRDFLKDKRNAAKLRRINHELTIKVMRESEVGEFTYDNDATYIDSNKNSAEYSYQKKRQYSGLLGFIPELDICSTMDFRRGNVSPCDGILNQLRKAVAQAKEAGKKIAIFRSDSAAHSNEIFKECAKEDIKYYISLSKNLAIKEMINSMDKKSWKRLSGKYEGGSEEYAEMVYVTNAGESARMLVLRWKNPDVTLFDQNPYCYHAIGTNDNEISPMAWLEKHNGRMNSENYNKEVKSGFNCDYTPSHDFEMNRCYFLLGILAYNVVQIMKLFYLSGRARKWTIKTLRYHFINVCGKIIKTARRYICKIINVTDSTFDLFRSCLFHLKMG
ncbi:MAG: IS1380 family transposase [Bacteroidota bacterium]|nr:IS1380 family transposase [Bacteroidota bacterium]